jgi:hypothetical protein
MQRLMPDSHLSKAERPLQLSFMKSWFISGLLIAGIVIGLHRPFRTMADRTPRPPATVPLHFDPVRLDPPDGPLRAVGAWGMRADDARLDGVSGLVLDGDEFVAITDSGVTLRFPKPDARAPVIAIRDLPSGPGKPTRKAGNDSEALARDPEGRGWWVAFESIHQLRLYDPGFSRTLGLRRLDGRRWADNGGVEGLAPGAGGLVLFAEQGDVASRFDGRALEAWPIDSPGRLSDAAALPDGRILILLRSLSPLGFSNGLALYDPARGATTALARLPLGHLDNAEGIAVEPRPDGVKRLWIVTDRDSRARGRTLLAAYDWKA